MRSLLVFSLALACLPQSDLRSEDTGLFAGAAVADISPTTETFQLRSGKSSVVHDPLHVRAVALQNGEGRCVIALVDAIGTGREETDEAKRIVAEKTGWPVESMLVSATHTHTAPKGGDTSPERIAYEKTRFEGIVAALEGAIASLRPAEIGFASDEEPSEVRNRRWFLKEGTMDPNPLGTFDQVRTNAPRQNLVKPAGPVDPEVAVIDIRDRKGKPLGFVANYALHYVGGLPKTKDERGREVGVASADYFGEFARIFPYRVGGSNPPADFVAFITNGASGDINNLVFTETRPPRAPFEQIQVVATKTADAAWRASRKIENYEENPVIATRERLVSIDYRKPSDDDLQRAIELMKLTPQERNEINGRTSGVAAQTIQYASPEMTKSEEVIVQAIRIGDQAIVSLPFEVLVEIGLELKERSPFPRTMIIELANGSHGYLPPPNQHELGGYETWLGTAKFEKNASVVLVDNLLEMLEELRAE